MDNIPVPSIDIELANNDYGYTLSIYIGFNNSVFTSVKITKNDPPLPQISHLRQCAVTKQSHNKEECGDKEQSIN